MINVHNPGNSKGISSFSTLFLYKLQSMDGFFYGKNLNNNILGQVGQRLSSAPSISQLFLSNQGKFRLEQAVRKQFLTERCQ